MYSKIIQIAPKRIDKKTYINLFDLTDDPYLSAHSQWYGTTYKYAQVVNEISRELRPFAFINKKRKTLTFKKPGSVQRQLQRSVLNAYRQKKSSGGSYADLISSIDSAGISHILFHYGEGQAHCHPLTEVLHDYLEGRLPKIVHIGGIVNYDNPSKKSK